MKNLTLHYYEHCPYCIRVLAYCGMAGIELNHRILLNDDEKTPLALIGQKMLPILQFSENGGREKAIGESLDIIEYLIQNSGYSLMHNKKDEKIVDNLYGELRMSVYSLAMPRWIKLSFGEFATPSSVEYFINKKSQSIGNFHLALEKTEALKFELKQLLEKYSAFFGWLKEQPDSYAALLLFSFLRGVTCVDGLDYPDSVMSFLSIMSKKSGVELLFDRAI